jgi:glycosyltransferase involved in cell wall biosynthesis
MTNTSPVTGTVAIVCPGGLENGGGIGRQMGYFLHADQGRDPRLVYRLIDSRGPWFLGASPLRTVLSVGYLAGSLLSLLVIRVSSSRCIAHINITGRGSTIRKSVFCGFARLIGLPYLLHLHDADYVSDYRRRGTLTKWVVRSVFRHAKKVIVLGERDGKLIPEELRLPPGQVAILHNAVPDPNPELPLAPKKIGAGHILFLGHLSARKGVPDLLQALASSALKEQTWRATLAGGGPIEEYRDMATRLGIAGRVTFPGWLDEVRVKALFADAEILVLPSYAEGLAMSVLEGLSHGMVVVATPVGAHAEVIETEVSGILVAPGNIDALASALQRVIADPNLQSRLSAGARTRFLEKFDVRGYAERLSRIHCSVLSDTFSRRTNAATQTS